MPQLSTTVVIGSRTTTLKHIGCVNSRKREIKVVRLPPAFVTRFVCRRSVKTAALCKRDNSVIDTGACAAQEGRCVRRCRVQLAELLQWRWEMRPQDCVWHDSIKNITSSESIVLRY